MKLKCSFDHMLEIFTKLGCRTATKKLSEMDGIIDINAKDLRFSEVNVNDNIFYLYEQRDREENRIVKRAYLIEMSERNLIR